MGVAYTKLHPPVSFDVIPRPHLQPPLHVFLEHGADGISPPFPPALTQTHRRLVLEVALINSVFVKCLHRRQQGLEL